MSDAGFHDLDKPTVRSGRRRLRRVLVLLSITGTALLVRAAVARRRRAFGAGTLTVQNLDVSGHGLDWRAPAHEAPGAVPADAAARRSHVVRNST
ncbi:hypothetical protein ACQEVZ_58700 [Dactylosporangium sp. CA-152071]|uniref:hypothetical protein n=1 Tax=Dactylosporangium sp. CA-152071 TaxID=3239933 RepID=UPI003D907636